MKFLSKLLFLVILAAMLFSTSACTVVEPWEREGLSSPVMQFDRDPIEKGLQEHHIDRREGSAGGNGSQSGGCGCG